MNDLLGQYVQASPVEALNSIVDCLKSECLNLLAKLCQRNEHMFAQLISILCEIFSLSKCAQKTEELSQISKLACKIVEIANKAEMHQLASQLSALTAKLEQESQSREMKFVWKESLLLRAIKQGHWIVLENIDKSNSAVLDRLNPLLEIGGTIIVNESDEIKTVKPHPDFRLISTASKVQGISEPFLNRCLHIKLRENAEYKQLYSVFGSQFEALNPSHTTVKNLELYDAFEKSLNSSKPM